MSAAAEARPAAPLLSSEQASKLLDGVLYERVLACIDLDGLFYIEEQLCVSLAGCGIPEDKVEDIACELIGQALVRVRDDPQRWETFGSEGLDDDCPLCVDVARAEAQATGARHRKNRKSKSR